MSDLPAATMAARRAAARAAVRFVERDAVMGVGTGTTAAAFIEAMADAGRTPLAAVASSVATAHLLRSAGIEVVDLPASGRLPLYVDGADEADAELRLIKGGGGAHAREKVLASASDVFVCIAEHAKLVGRLGTHPVPVEVLPMARAFVARELALMGGTVVERAGFVSDNGNVVLDASGLDLVDPVALEKVIDEIAGVVACGVFALRPADLLLLGSPDGTAREIRRPTR